MSVPTLYVHAHTTTVCNEHLEVKGEHKQERKGRTQINVKSDKKRDRQKYIVVNP